jgi:hypothetical protein
LYSWFLAEKEVVDSCDESSEGRTTVQTNRALGNPRVVVEDGKIKVLPKNVVKKTGQKRKASTGSTRKPSEKSPYWIFPPLLLSAGIRRMHPHPFSYYNEITGKYFIQNII